MDYSYRPPQPQAAYGSYPPAGSGYGHTQPAAHAYYPPPPAPHQHYQHHQPQPPQDPFRNFYATRLRELTFNSRPIIQELSLIAMQQRDQKNWANMQIVVEEIEAAALRAAPQAKLPILYLIDSISKNVMQPFATDLFPPIITRLYTRVYRDVDGVTKSKMEEMIALWRTAGPGRTDLYGPAVRDAIEREIFGSGGMNPALLQSRQPPLTREVVLQKLQATLDGKQREAADKPWDPTPRHQIGVLKAIGDLLHSSQVPNDDLPKIMEQLRSMAPVVAAPPPPQVQAPTPTYPTFNPAAPPPGMPGPNLPPFPPPMAQTGYGTPTPSMPPMAPTLSQNGTPIPSTSTPVPGQPPSSLAPAIPANVADILRNLNASGILSNPRTPETKPVALKSALDNYEDMILSLDLRLDSLDLNRMNAVPIAHLPQRCKQCGIRFPEGEAKMQAHLDWHFRRNKSSTTAGGRGAHRRWLPKAEEWVSDFANNAEAGPGPGTTAQRHGSPSTQAGASGGNKLSAEQLARYAQRKVPAPQDPIKAGKPCPICKEHWKAELEDDEWIWRNAIDIAGTIYHATCRAEQMNARKNAKLLNPNGRLSGSPRITPQLGEGGVGAGEGKIKEGTSPVKVEPVSAPTQAGSGEVNVTEVKVEVSQAGEGGAEVERQGGEDQANGPVKRKAEEEQEEANEEVKRVKVEPLEGDVRVGGDASTTDDPNGVSAVAAIEEGPRDGIANVDQGPESMQVDEEVKGETKGNDVSTAVLDNPTMDGAESAAAEQAPAQIVHAQHTPVTVDTPVTAQVTAQATDDMDPEDAELYGIGA